MPKQLRSQRVVKAIVNATRMIMADQGAAALSTNAIAERAGVNIATLYRWFPNKEAIIHEVFEEEVQREIDELMARVQRYVDGEPLELSDLLDLVIDPLVDRQIRFLSINACFYQNHQHRYDVGRRHVEALNDQFSSGGREILALMLKRRVVGVSDEDAELRASLAFWAIEGMCYQAAKDNPQLMRGENFKQEIRLVVRRYLGV